MYKIKRFSVRNPRGNVSRVTTKMSSIPGVIPHPNPRYSKYIYGWEDPNNPGQLISKFKVNVSKEFEKDQKLLPDHLDPRNKKLKTDTLKGNFIFEDDDNFIRNNINKKGDYCNWDTCIHILDELINGNDGIIYSKDIDNRFRFTYIVYRPEIDFNGDYFCRVKISRCNDHKVENEKYDNKNTKSTFGDLEELQKLKENFSNSNVGKLYSSRGNLIYVVKRFSSYRI